MKLSIPQVYADIARAYPRNALAQYNTVLDSVQIFSFALMKGERQPSLATATVLPPPAAGTGS